MKILASLATVLAVSFASFGLGHAQQAPKAKAGAARGTRPRLTQAEAPPANSPAAGWIVRCTSASRDAPLECAMEQTAVLTKTGQLIVLINIRVPSDTRAPVAVIQLPLGLNLPAGAKLQVDDGKVTDLQIQTCENARLLRQRRDPARHAGRDEGGQAAEGLVPEPRQGSHHHPDAAGGLRRGVRQDQVILLVIASASEAIHRAADEEWIASSLRSSQ